MSRLCQHTAPCQELRFELTKEEFRLLLDAKKERLAARMSPSEAVPAPTSLESRRMKKVAPRLSPSGLDGLDGLVGPDMEEISRRQRRSFDHRIAREALVVEAMLEYLDHAGPVVLDLDDLLFLRNEPIFDEDGFGFGG